MEEDVLIQNGLGRFFAAKLRSGVLFEIYTRTGNAQAGKLALAKYQEARERVGRGGEPCKQCVPARHYLRQCSDAAWQLGGPATWDR